ncbi:Acetyl-CoA carboxylase, carboxyltransferase component [Lachnospiraceae bacterium XBB1006]|nr:Acetyl-CoA carboxylase, carboxyltransferase component [Lachnospiraceae bacterium XBB1006]
MSVMQSNVARDRILSFLDEGSFVELFETVTCRNTDLSLKDYKELSDGVVTGYGLMNGRLVFIYSQNPEVLHGSLGEMHCRKIVELYAQALKMGAPMIALLDSSGLRLQEGVDALTGLGEVLSAVNEASGIIPMYSVIYGNCGGGLSVIPALSDFTYMVEGKGRLFVNSPNTIDANYQEKVDTADGQFKALYSGIVDECLSENEISEKVRTLLSLLPANNTEGIYTETCLDDLNRLVEGMNASNYEATVLLTNISDGYEFVETKSAYAPEMITGFIQLNGMTIGALANRENSERLTVDGLLKGTDFVRFCDAYDIPILVVADTCGFETSMVAEKAIGRSMAAFVSALCEADVPKVTLLPHKAMGSAYLLMNSKAMGADFVYAWPDAEMGILPAKQAVEILYANDNNVSLNDKMADYEQSHNSVEAFAKRAQIDRVIAPESTRKYLVSAFDLLYTKYACVQEKKHNLR